MAKMLIRIQDKPNDIGDTDKYLKGRFFAGDIIRIIGDSENYSESEENAADKIVLTLINVSVEDVKEYLISWFGEEIDGELSVIKQRKYNINMVNFTPVNIQLLENAVVSPATRLLAFQNLMIDKTI